MPNESSRLPRVLFVATTKSEGGIERYALRLASSLRARGLSIIFACRPGSFLEAQCQAEGIPTRPFRVRNSGDLGASLRLAGIVRQERIDLVHVHSRRDYVPVLLGVGLSRHLRVVLHAHLIRALGTPERLNGWFFRQTADAVVAVSRAVQERLMAAHGLPIAFVPLIHNGVDVDAFPAPETPRAREWRSQRRREWGFSEDAPVLGMVGRLNAKGQPRLLQALPALHLRFPSLRVVLVGPEGEPGDQARLQSQAEAGGVADAIVFGGSREDIPTVMAALDILVHLPDDESFGLALVEAMAAGLPTVATDIGGCREVVQDGITGLLVPPGDAPALEAALQSLLIDPARRSALGQAGRQVAVQDFSLTGQVDRLVALYQHLCPHPMP